ncbi:universal stress protein [Methylobacterium oryzae CBMB20]
MSYASLMVAVDDGRHARTRVRLAADLADRFGARLVGVGACMPAYPRLYGETATPIDLIFDQIRQAALDRLASTEQTFWNAACRNERVTWRSALEFPVRFLEEQARAADLIVVGRPADDEGADPTVRISAGDALMGVGRPTLIVPPGVEHLEARRILIGWKNTPQTRRAVSDALPLLRRAEAVRVVRVADDRNPSEVDDVVRYLALHDVAAGAHPVKPTGWTVADTLQAAATEFGVDLIVTGAYGYSRLREWFFGGVTRDLLAGASLCCLMSH